MNQTTPCAIRMGTSKTAGLARVLDIAPRGYRYYVAGQCPAHKLKALLAKFHERYGIGCSPAQRVLRKKKGLANALVVLYWAPERAPNEAPECAPGEVSEPMPHRSPRSAPGRAPGYTSSPAPQDMPNQSRERASNAAPAQSPAELPKRHCDKQLDSLLLDTTSDVQVQWLLLTTAGAGPVWELETLQDVREKPRLCWLGYELVQHPVRGRAAWTWRRPKQSMAELYALLGAQLNARRMADVEATLLRISRQPGFSGVREQSKALYAYAKAKGYPGELPFLFFVQKRSHGQLIHFDVR